MDKPLTSPLLIEQVVRPIKITPDETFAHLNNFLVSLESGPSKTQLERLADALGVEVGAIAPSEGQRREESRASEAALLRAARKAKREAERDAKIAEHNKKKEEALEAELEVDEDHLEMGENDFEGDQTMDDRGDVEYGDAVDDDNDEPDNEEE